MLNNLVQSNLILKVIYRPQFYLEQSVCSENEKLKREEI